MGKGQSKQVEEEQININVPVNSPHLAGDRYEVHQYHGGTIKAVLVIMLVLILVIILCVVAVKRLCRNVRNIGVPQMATPSVVYTKKGLLPDI